MPPPDPLPSVLDLLKSVSAFAAARIEKTVTALSQREQAQLAAAVSAVDSQAGGYRVFGTALSYWAGPARAWMLLELQELGALTSNPPGFFARPPNDIQQLVDSAARLSAQDIMDNLADRLSGRKIIAALAAAQADKARCEALKTWVPAKFTAPASHRPDAFRYLIHGLRRETNIGLATASPARKDYVRLHLSAYIDAETGSFRSGRYYLENPGIVAQSLLSCSVITAEKVKTYADMYFGFILHVPDINIGAASDRDMDMGFDKATRPDMLATEPDKRIRMALISDSFVQGVASLFSIKLPTLEELVAATRTDGHNEVAVIGQMGMSTVRVCGLFLKVAKGKAMLPAEYDRDQKEWGIRQCLLDCADRLGVPIVMVPDPAVAAGSTWFPAHFGGH